MATAPVQLDEEALIREFVSQIPLPPGVKLKRIDQSEDWTGDPVLRIYFASSKKYGYGPARIKALIRVQNELQQRVFDAKIEKWPFVHFLEAR